MDDSPVADSQSNGFIERGIRSRFGSSVSVHSSIFLWIVEHADIWNNCHVAGANGCLND